ENLAALVATRETLASDEALARPMSIRNSDRSVGAALSGEIVRRRRECAISDAPLVREFRGSAGQSFGAFLADGITFHLTGEANDYVGKSLSGGTIVIASGAAASRRGDVLAGNTVLYGATSGQLYIGGRAGESLACSQKRALA